jgi:hypothetical protein
MALYRVGFSYAPGELGSVIVRAKSKADVKRIIKDNFDDEEYCGSYTEADIPHTQKELKYRSYEFNIRKVKKDEVIIHHAFNCC